MPTGGRWQAFSVIWHSLWKSEFGWKAAGETCFEFILTFSRYEYARKEILDSSETDIQSLPYLSGIVKEGLRLSLANPTRLPRIVPSGGPEVPVLLKVPAGTSVGLGAYVLHHNPEVFHRPNAFMPERWLDPSPEMLPDSIEIREWFNAQLIGGMIEVRWQY